MKIVYDKGNKVFGSYIQTILNSNPYYKKIENLELNIVNNKIELINYNYKKKVKISVDFINKENEDFKKIFKKKGTKILDCTAGFGRDGFILARYGFSVTMIEKNPITILLLRNGIRKLTQKFKINERLKLLYGDSYEYLRLSNELYDYIYIDFMFNKFKNSSLSSKNDEALKLITNDRENRVRLLDIAKNKCKYRVVVKNHKHLPSIDNINPDYQVKTKLLRYDIFLAKNGSAKRNS